MNTLNQAILLEHRFWLQILGDHARFILTALSKAHEFSGYLRSGVDRFPALDRLNCQVKQEIRLFSAFLAEIRRLVAAKKALGALLPLIPGHMLREECYFLIKLAQVTDLECPPATPPVRG